MQKTSFFDDQILMIHSTEMDFLTAIEGGARLPIAMEDFNALGDWVKENKLTIAPIGRRRNAVVVSGKVMPWGHPEGLSYSQIWVAVRYRAYRDSVRAYLRALEGSEKVFHLYDVDHAVSKARLNKIWPAAWVNLILVERSMNRAVGAMLEKDPLNIANGQQRIEMNAECILKAFLEQKGALSRPDLASYLKACRDRFISLSGKGSLMSNGSISAQLAKFTMSEHADEFFAQICRDTGIAVSDVLPPKKMIIAYPGGSLDEAH